MFGQQQQQPTSIRGNAQVCAFYLKGQCKYGTQCWNLHPPNQAGGMANTFGGGGNVFGAKTGGPQADSKEFTEFVKQVSGEMTQWERSGQWLLSSFTPLKSHPLLSGFSDLSPEELRTKAYDALKANTSPAYQEHWSKLQQQYKHIRDALRVPTADAYQAMKEVFHAIGGPEQQQQQQLQNPSQTGKTTSLFGKSSVFGGNAAQPQPGAGLLGAKPQSSLFGGGGSLFGANQTTSTDLYGDTVKKPLFGGPAPLGSQNTSSFAAQPNASPFGGGGNNLFKSPPPNTLSSGSVFGGPPKIQGNSLFGAGATTITSIPSSGNSMFGSGGTGNTGSLFGGGASVNVSTPGAGNMFGGGTSTNTTTQAAGSIFGGNPTNTSTPSTGNLFGGSTTVTAIPATGSVFGGSQNQSSGIFGNSNQNSTPTFGGMGVSGTTASVFGNTNTASVFGNSNTNETSGNMFGNKPSIFGGAQNPPQQQQQQQQQNTTSLFGNPVSGTPGIFGAKPLTETQPQNTAPSIFGGTPTFGRSVGSINPVGGNGLFGNAPSSGMQSSGVFGNPSESASGQGLFGKPAESQNLFADNEKNPNLKAEWFTPLDQLDLSDKGQFEAVVFTSIPLCPPPLELCF